MKIPPIYFIGPLVLGAIGFGIFNLLKGKDIPSPAATAPSAITAQVSGGTVKIAGSKSLANLNEKVKTALPGINILSKAGGSKEGIRLLRAGRIDIAAVSEKVEVPGFKVIPVATDSIAFFSKEGASLTTEELKGLFGSNRVVNSPVGSGTRKTVEQILGISIPSSAKAVKVDALTGSEGVINNLSGLTGYGSADQVTNQKTISIIPIDGKNPGDEGYAFNRDLYYVVKENPSPAVQAVVDAASKL